MSNTSALDKLVELTQDLLNKASVDLANSRKSEKQAKDFLQALLGYRADYTMEMQRLMLEGMSAMTLNHYRAFVNSLDSAIQQANATLKSLEQAVQNNQDDWMDKYQKVNAYETLIDRRLKSVQIKESRREQRQTDEISSQLRLRQARNAFSSPGFN
ncbi:flagellar export protein FliJ [Pseudomonas putida]|uniref:Flagellar FliJ protein n=1 Tax=Pseudomonas putida TaxID=303 RepID=A0A8I1EB66_PSEPU|nr:flagellar export protein FliJ [Pseudomonas putida]MBI6882545.1 flagellar export protein FliJ [Pseudomonas putida]